MSAITTHVLDLSSGRPAAGLAVMLEQHDTRAGWTTLGRDETDGDGRARRLMPSGAQLVPAIYRLTFDTRGYFHDRSIAAFCPTVVIVFETTSGETHYHVPLLLSPFGYTTYRGS